MSKVRFHGARALTRRPVTPFINAG
jgi:hypothetical protein